MYFYRYTIEGHPIFLPILQCKKAIVSTSANQYLFQSNIHKIKKKLHYNTCLNSVNVCGAHFLN